MYIFEFNNCVYLNVKEEIYCRNINISIQILYEVNRMNRSSEIQYSFDNNQYNCILMSKKDLNIIATKQSFINKKNQHPVQAHTNILPQISNFYFIITFFYIVLIINIHISILINQQMFKLGLKQQWENKHNIYKSSIFHIPLKPLQKAIINCNLSHDVLVNLPTGFGKSLLYQYPAFHSFKITIVFVPLRALLYDSIIQAKKINIQAAEMSEEIIQKCLKFNQIRILLLTPQKLAVGKGIFIGLAQLIKADRIQKFVIDEAHCISQWGNDFRPAYSQLWKIRASFPYIRILAMTATAPPKIRQEIIKKLQIQNCYFFQITYNRSNLYYQVRNVTKKNLCEQIEQVISQNGKGKQSGIIYCQTIKLAEKIYQQLKITYPTCQVFHSKISDKKRNQILVNFKKDQCKLLIATICFGMGVNKPNVRFVIHAGMSLTIQNYYQESGRAGRDGLRANCILIHYQGQQATLNFLINRDSTLVMKRLKTEKLIKMKNYVDSGGCRRSQMFKYLGEQFEKKQCNKFCDNCNSKQKQYIEIDFSEKGKFILEKLGIQKIFLTRNQLVSYLKGNLAKKKRLINLYNKQLNGYLRHQKEQDIKFYVDGLMKEGYLVNKIKKSKFRINIYLRVDKRRLNKNRIILYRQKKVKAVEKKQINCYRQVKQQVRDLQRQYSNIFEQGKIIMKQQGYNGDESIQYQDYETYNEQDEYVNEDEDDRIDYAINIDIKEQQQVQKVNTQLKRQASGGYSVQKNKSGGYSVQKNRKYIQQIMVKYNNQTKNKNIYMGLY